MSTLSRRDFLAALTGAFAALAPRLARAQTPPLLVDGHVDLGWNMVNYGRDYTRSAYLTRADEGQTPAGRAMHGLPQWLQARMALLFGVVFVMPARHAAAGQVAVYSTPDEAHAWGWAMLDAVTALAQHEQVTLVDSTAALDGVLASWAGDAPQVGVLLALEGADPLRTPDDLEAWYARGLRSIGLAWAGTRYAGGSIEPGGLTDDGRALLRAMGERGMLLDTAHLAEQAFWEALEIWDGALAYTHGNSRYFLPGERGLSDEQIRALAERGGVMGIGLYDGFYAQHRAGRGVGIADVINAITYVCDLLGTCEHVAIGADFDGGFGAERAPQGFDTAADLPMLAWGLQAHGFTPEQVDAVLHGNWLRLMRRVLW